ncbi:MAG: 16S rRNA (cytidine(1402)-2'-O)-methyltransferase [Simkania sp.]|nr:16S rRNA (cytidine(1402)-2'-O)-methyltransferase [Simkania sp.]
MLFLIATPIGHLADITFRAVETLQRCSYILCEDTRHSRHLLDHYNIKTPLKSFHKFNESKKESEIIEDLKEGKEVALISDAGMPLICDPGAKLVEACRDHDIAISVIPGPSACISALALTGWFSECFQFVGFLPKGEALLKKTLSTLLHYPGTSIAYETPQRLVKTLAILKSLDPSRRVAVARELTKTYEECKVASAENLHLFYVEHPPRGEIVLLIHQEIKQPPVINEAAIIQQVKTLAHDLQIPLSDAIRRVALETGISRKKIYTITHLALDDVDC